MNTLGDLLNPVLIELENAVWDYESKFSKTPQYHYDGFKAIVKIFMSAMLDKLWELQEKEDIPQKSREEMALKCGEQLRQLIKTYTDIDTHNFYK